MRIETLLQDPEVGKARSDLLDAIRDMFDVGRNDEPEWETFVASVVHALAGEGEELELAKAAASIEFVKGGPFLGDEVETAIESLQRLDKAVTAAVLPLLARVATLEAENERLTGVLNLANDTTASWRRKCDAVEAERDRLLAAARKVVDTDRAVDAVPEGRERNLALRPAQEAFNALAALVDTLLGETGR